MGLRKGEYVGFWCPPELKRWLNEQAEAEYRNLSQEVIKRLEESKKASAEKEREK
jgi:hypothetical protein